MTARATQTLLHLPRQRSLKGQRDLFDGGFVCCLVCGRKLTSERSRQRGIGPACERQRREEKPLPIT